MKIIISIICSVFILFLCATVIQAQVTIGSTQPPRAGALLDLKEDNVTTKGLGLPRVALSSLENLTIGLDVDTLDYAGTMVYNTSNYNEIKEGLYYWTGSTWKQVIVVNSKGVDGTMLISNGDGTYGWSAVTIPDFKYHKPTNIRGITDGTAKDCVYQYGEIVCQPVSGQDRYKPCNNLFDNTFVYTDILHMQTGVSTPKYMLLGMSISTQKMTVNKVAPAKTTWESLQVEVILTRDGADSIVKTYKRVINVTAGGSALGYLDLFSVISLSDIKQGDYEIKIRVSNLLNTFKYNEGGAFGNFSPSIRDFYTVKLEDLNLVLYEYE